MANQKMGYEGILYTGTAGATATTQLENTRDITLEYDTEEGDTTVRGDSTGPPVNTSDPTALIVGLTFIMVNDITDSNFQTLSAAAAAGSLVALRGIDYSAGKGPDGDFHLKRSAPWPLKGEQVVTFTATPSRGAGRTPSLYV